MTNTSLELELLTPIQLELLTESIARKVAERMLEQPRLVSREQIAVITSTSVSAIDLLVRTGEIPCIRRDARVLFDPAEVVSALKTRDGVATDSNGSGE